MDFRKLMSRFERLSIGGQWVFSWVDQQAHSVITLHPRDQDGQGGD